MTKYRLTDEDKARLPEWRDRWIANAMSTKHVDAEERRICRDAVLRLYRAANLPPPPEHRIVFVPSPFVLAFGGGFAAAWWWLRRNAHPETAAAVEGAIYDAVRRATRDAVLSATYGAVDDATDDAVRGATDNAVWGATYDAAGTATHAAVRRATADAVRSATTDAVWGATADAVRAATYDAVNSATYDAVRRATRDAVLSATYGAVDDATDDAVRGATADAVHDATYDAIRGATGDAVRRATRAAVNSAATDAVRRATADAVRAATADAVWGATHAAVRNATHDAVWGAARGAVHAATADAVWGATHAAVRSATDDAVRSATADAVRSATDDAVRSATEGTARSATGDGVEWYSVPLMSFLDVGRAYLPYQRFGVECAQIVYRMWQGGNQWSPLDSYLSFFRHVAQIDVDFSHYDAWEQLALHSGPRVVHPEFCIISDRPELLTVDEQRRPHNGAGPFCRWRDGTALYAVHGARVPQWVVEHPERITAQAILANNNAETRRVMIEKIGLERFVRDAGLRPVQEDDCGRLYRIENDATTFVEVVNRTPQPDGSFKHYFLAADPAAQSAAQAVADSFGLNVETYRAFKSAGMVEV